VGLQWTLGILALLLIAGNLWASVKLAPHKQGGLVKRLSVDGESFDAWLHYDSLLAQQLKAEGFAMDGHAFLHWPLADSSRQTVAHELVHLVRWFLRCQQFGKVLGSLLYRLENAGQYLTQWVHNRRGGEEEARLGERPLAEHPEGASIVVRGKLRLVTALCLLEVPNP